MLRPVRFVSVLRQIKQLENIQCQISTRATGWVCVKIKDCHYQFGRICQWNLAIWKYNVEIGILLKFPKRFSYNTAQSYRAVCKVRPCKVLAYSITLSLADPGAPPARTSQQDPIPSFSHVFFPKSIHVRDWCPTNGSAHPNGKSWIRHWLYLHLKKKQTFQLNIITIKKILKKHTQVWFW